MACFSCKICAIVKSLCACGAAAILATVLLGSISHMYDHGAKGEPFYIMMGVSSFITCLYKWIMPQYDVRIMAYIKKEGEEVTESKSCRKATTYFVLVVVFSLISSFGTKFILQTPYSDNSDPLFFSFLFNYLVYLVYPVVLKPTKSIKPMTLYDEEGNQLANIAFLVKGNYANHLTICIREIIGKCRGRVPLQNQ